MHPATATECASRDRLHPEGLHKSLGKPFHCVYLSVPRQTPFTRWTRFCREYEISAEQFRLKRAADLNVEHESMDIWGWNRCEMLYNNEFELSYLTFSITSVDSWDSSDNNRNDIGQLSKFYYSYQLQNVNNVFRCIDADFSINKGEIIKMTRFMRQCSALQSPAGSPISMFIQVWKMHITTGKWSSPSVLQQLPFCTNPRHSRRRRINATGHIIAEGNRRCKPHAAPYH